MTATPIPDTEGGCRTWLRTVPEVSALVGSRVWFAVPDDTTDDDYPCLTVQRVGGRLGGGEAPVDEALLQLTVIGPRRDKAATDAVARAVRGAVAATLRQRTVWDAATAVCLGAAEESCLFTVDPVDGRPRYSVTVTASVVHPSA